MIGSTRKTEVVILGERHTLWSDLPATHLEAVARDVDARLRTILQHSPQVAPLQAAVSCSTAHSALPLDSRSLLTASLLDS